MVLEDLSLHGLYAHRYAYLHMKHFVLGTLLKPTVTCIFVQKKKN